MANRVCPWWLAYTFDNALRALFHKPERIFGGIVQPGMTVADIGCGMGYFSMGLARIVTESGKVIAADLQDKMLTVVERRAKRAGLAPIIQTHRCASNAIGIAEPIDVALASWMVHETPDRLAFFQQVHAILRQKGRFLMTEPKFHVPQKEFSQEIDTAIQAGFRVEELPKVAFSHAVLLEKGGGGTGNSA